MFTNNYINYKIGMFRNSTNTSGSNWYLTDVTGANFMLIASSDGDADLGGVGVNYCRFSESLQYSGTYFGTGTTPATKDDIKLESVITSGLSYRHAGNTVFQEADGHYVFEIRNELTNESEADISISEMGIVRALYYTTSSDKYALFDRTVLDTPIVIAPGETRLVTYRINFNQTLV